MLRVYSLFCFPDEALQLVQQLQEFEEKSKACTTFINTREEDRWHYREGKNVLSIYLVAKPGWVFEDDFIPKIKKWNRDFDRPYNRDNLYGCAGYDNSVAETHPMLIGKGPAFTNEGNVFVSNSSLVVSAVDVYPLLTHVLDMRLAKDRAGRIDSLVQILANHPKGHDVKETIENLVEYVKDPEHLPLEGEGRNKSG